MKSQLSLEHSHDCSFGGCCPTESGPGIWGLCNFCRVFFAGVTYTACVLEGLLASMPQLNQLLTTHNHRKAVVFKRIDCWTRPPACTHETLTTSAINVNGLRRAQLIE